MNVFLIPSWYPSSSNPISGIFVKEEARFLAELHPGINVVVSLHGNGDFGLDLKRPATLWGTLRRFIRASGLSEVACLPNLVEINRPRLTWTLRLFNGNLRQQIDAHRKNFLRAVERFGKPDLIHAHVTYPAGWIAMQLASEFGVPYIIKECMGPFPFRTPKFVNPDGSLTHWISEPLQNAQQTIAMSPMLADGMAAYGLKRPLVIPYPVDERRFEPEVVRRQGQFSFFTMCGLSAEKGIPDLLRAIPLALREVPDLVFRIGGPGRLQEYRQLANELGIEHAVEWLGPVSREDAPRRFAECSAFIMVSHLETFGMVYAEAIACGKPVIATRCGGPEFIVNDKNGLLVDVGNIVQIANAMVEMYRIHDRFDRNEIRQDFLVRFSRNGVIDRIVQCYREVLAK
jgi:glycosyltransferase involved in cell wall biosynthesis